MAFEGFPKDFLHFFMDLEDDNSKAFFDANRDRYERSVREPSRAFVEAVGDRLAELRPAIHAEPKVNKSLFRINRDTRFSDDKTPYKTNMAAIMWEGDGKRMECPGFYFHVEPTMMMVGGGLYMIPKSLIGPWRDAVADEFGAELPPAIAAIEKAGFEVGGETLKRVPRGYDGEHPRAELLKRKGFYFFDQGEVPDIFFEPGIVDHVVARWEAAMPVHAWLVEMVERYG